MTDPTDGGGAGTPMTAFISYSHADKPIAQTLALSLEERGCKVWIDENELRVGDSLIEQIATAIAGVDFFLVLISEDSVGSAWCQREVSLAVTGDIGRVGSVVMPVRIGDVAMPATLADKLYLHLDPKDVPAATERLIRDMRAHRKDPRIAPHLAATRPRTGAGPKPAPPSEPIRIIGIVEEGVGVPRNDSTPGSALYRVPLKLNRTPDARWSRLFRANWDSPPSFTTMHRPGIGSVVGSTIVLDGTTIDELERYHAKTLKLAVDATNQQVAAEVARERTLAEQKSRN